MDSFEAGSSTTKRRRLEDWTRPSLPAALPVGERAKLVEAGFDSVVDLAALSLEELSDVLGAEPSPECYIAQQCGIDATRLRADARAADALSRPAVITPRAKPSALQPKLPAIAVRSVRRQFDTRKRKQEIEDPREVLAKERAAAPLVELVLAAGAASAFHDELRKAEKDNQYDKWLDTLLRSLVRMGDARQLRHALATWKRWQAWVGNHYPEFDDSKLFTPPAVVFADFVEDTARGGPTAAQSIFAAFKWLKIHLGFSGFPLDSPLLRGRERVDKGHQSSPQDEMPLKVYSHFLALAKEDSVLGFFASGVLALLSFDLRFAHSARFQFHLDKCTPRTLVGVVYRGKNKAGAPFWCSAPSHIAPDWPLLEAYLDRLVKETPEGEPLPTFLIPDIEVVGGVLCRIARSRFRDR